MKMRGLAGVGVLALMACGGDSGTDPDPNPGELSATLVGSTQRQGQAGEFVAPDLEVEVRRNGEPAAGVTVQFKVADTNCGQAVAGTVTTGQNGRASDRWQLGKKLGECKLEVSTIEKAGATPVLRGSFTATVSAGPAAAISLWPNFFLSGVDRVTVPLGDSVKISSLYRAMVDKFGNAVEGPAPALTATLTKGSAIIRGGYIVAPAAEGTGEIEIKAAGVPAVKTLYTAVRDLRDETWTTSLLCKDTGHLTVGGARVDSIRWDVTSDSVTYYALGDPRIYQGEERGPVASFYFSGRKRSWLAGGKVDTATVKDWRREVFRQRVDTLTVLSVTAAGFQGAPAATPSIRTSNNPVTFTGGTYCPDSTGLKTSPKMVLKAQP